MLAPEYLESVTDDIVRLFSQLENDITADMARRINRMNFMSATSEWQRKKLAEAGFCREEIIKKVAEYSKKSEKEIRRLFDEAAEISLEYDDAAYKRHGQAPPPFNQSPQMLQMIAASAKKTGRTLRNLTMTTAEFGEQELIQALDSAYMQVASGAMSHQEAVYRAVKALTDKGGTSVLYPSGHIDKIDVAVRRAVLTGVSQTVGTLTEMRLDEMQHDLVETSAHAGARPDHAEWQGQRFSYSGKDKRYPDFVSCTGYGTGAGLMGWNCRHNFFPVWEEDPYTYTKADLEELNARNIEYEGEKYTLYEITQMQRRVERGIRKSKRALSAFDAVLADDSTNAAVKKAFLDESVWLKRREAKLRDIVKQTGVDRRAYRERVVGFGRGVSARATAAAKTEYNEYIKVLGKENLPKTFDLFLDMRYNNSEAWKDIKDFYQYKSNNPKSNRNDYNCVKELRELFPNGSFHIPPTNVDVKILKFNDNHINAERNHKVTETMAKDFILKAKASQTVWNGHFERYYSENGAAYVNNIKQEIRTAYTKNEFDTNMKIIMEVLKKYGI